MGLVINTNISALVAQRNVNRTTGRLQRNIERLSSGLRINSARDDAAGLSIANRFTARIRGVNQAIRNANDGLSLAQTAEGALDETTNIIQRVRELAVQAANGANSDDDRASLQDEVAELLDEVDRIAADTTFNGQALLDGSVAAKRIQVGADARQTVTLRIGASGASALGRQVRETGDPVDAATALAAGALTINGVDIRAPVAADDVRSTADNANSAIAKGAAINDGTPFSDVRAIVEPTEVVGGAIAGGDLDAADNITINGSTISGITVQASDADDALVDAINAVADDTGVIASIDADSQLVLTADDGRNITVVTSSADAANFTGLNAGAETVTTGGSLVLQSTEPVELTINAAGADTAVGFGNGVGTTLLGIDAANALSSVDISTVAGANRAIDIADVALQQVLDIRSGLGASQNRISSALSTLASADENLQSARSRILDVDLATESADFARNSILQQAGVSILAQANTRTEVALQLLSS